MTRKNRRNEVRWVGPTIAAIVAALLAVFLFSGGLDAGPTLPGDGPTTTPAVAPTAPPAPPTVAPEVPPAPTVAKSSPEPEPAPRVAPLRPPGSLVRPAGALVKQGPQPRTMSCDDVLNLHETHVPVEIIVDILERGGGPIPDDGCLVDAGADDALLEALDALR